jgi:hypothetical protein
MSTLLAEPATLDGTAGFLVLLPARPERGGREAGRTGRRAEVLSAVGPVMVVSKCDLSGKSQRYLLPRHDRLQDRVGMSGSRGGVLIKKSTDAGTGSREDGSR